jgi:Flp pilus assembly protein TadD
MLEENLYYPDGQIFDEVYVYGSFLQSKMYREGVTCTDCHDSHSLRVHTTGNDLCATCHVAQEFDTPSHHHHDAETPGAACVDCHMPTRNYMVVDPRLDHSLRIPRPDLTEKLGAPNACNGCHADRSAGWAAQSMDRWYGEKWRSTPHYGEALHAGRNRLPGAGAELVRLAEDSSRPGIVRATALSLLSGYEGTPMVAAVEEGISSLDPMIRMGAASALQALDPRLRFQIGQSLLDDPVRAVRIEAALVLASTPKALMTREQREALDRAVEEYREVQLVSAERPESHLNLGLLHVYRGELVEAENAYRMAIRLGPTFIPAYVNLADVRRAQGNEDEVERVLRQALEVAPGDPEVHHALGLALVRQERMPEAVESLRRASELGPDRTRFAYVYGVALYGEGETDEALAVLRGALERAPGNTDLLTGLATISADVGRREEAVAYAKKLLTADPQNAVARQLMQRLDPSSQ